MTEFERIVLSSEKWQITNDDDTLNYQLGRIIEENGWWGAEGEDMRKGESARNKDRLFLSICLFTEKSII